MLPLALDGVVAVLLVLSLALGFKLHSALRRLHNDNTDFHRLIGALDTATERARAALEALKGTAGDAGERLSGGIGQAQRLLDDLRFLCERGERLADRLAGQIETGRRTPPPVRTNAAARRPPAPPPADLERTLRTLR
jgi:Domain of unknown function (DUF6468)